MNEIRAVKRRRVQTIDEKGEAKILEQARAVVEDVRDEAEETGETGETGEAGEAERAEEYDPSSPALPSEAQIKLLKDKHIRQEEAYYGLVHGDGSLNIDMPPDLAYRIVPLGVEQDQTDQWPKATHECCLWDMQPFQGFPLGIPEKWDEIHHKMHLRGFFCSFACLIAYMQNDPVFKFHFDKLDWVRKFARDFFGTRFTPCNLIPAPPREKLSQLHAKHALRNHPEPMRAAIAEFRTFHQHTYVKAEPPPFVRVTFQAIELQYKKDKEQQQEKRMQLSRQGPKPIALTRMGMHQQERHVYKRTSTKKAGDDAESGDTIDQPKKPKNLLSLLRGQ